MDISKKKEDIFIVEKALQNNACIISFDNWKDEKEKFNDDYDWEDVNSRTLGILNSSMENLSYQVYLTKKRLIHAMYPFQSTKNSTIKLSF